MPNTPSRPRMALRSTSKSAASGSTQRLKLYDTAPIESACTARRTATRIQRCTVDLLSQFAVDGPVDCWAHRRPNFICLVQRTMTRAEARSEEHPSELQSIMRLSYAVF